MTNMQTPEQTAALLVAAAERSESIVSVVEEDGAAGVWLVEMETGAECLVERVAEPLRLVLTSAIGWPDPDRLVELLQAALSFNSMLEQTLGTRVACDNDGPQLLLLQELYPESLEMHSMDQHLANFEALRSWWSLVLQRPPADLDRKKFLTELAALRV